ncbi:MAG: helix-turn-helix domain-containing protein [Pseudonocardia sp.]|nr:helix-turn-helix domain-containing protein [Pseudonocardia sp.]
MAQPAVDDVLLARVRELRDAGRSPKEIARALGMRPSAVAPLVRTVAAQAVEAQAGPELVGCWVSPLWRVGLAVDGHDDWPSSAAPDGAEAGLVFVVVARRHLPRRSSVVGFLVDTYCLGVKNAVEPRIMNDREVPAFLDTFFSAFADPPLAAPLDLGRHLVLGAVDYARGLGFEPHPDFAAARGHLGEWSEASAITFGRDGMPFYMSGPHDNPNAVIRTLTRTVGDGNFHFLTGLG